MEEHSSSSHRLKSIVMGGSGALGSAVTAALLKRGDHVICLDKNVPELSETPFVQMDVRDKSSVETALLQAKEQLGGLDVLVHAAGIMETCSFLELEDSEFEAILDVNLMGAFRVAQASGKMMIEHGGRIVLVTSIHGQIGVHGRAAYAASKGGVASMARVMAAELAHHGIRVNVLAPGAVDGGMLPEPKARQGWVEATPSNRVAFLDEVASVAAMLTSEDASFVNGQIVAVDGGVSTIRQFGPLS